MSTQNLRPESRAEARRQFDRWVVLLLCALVVLPLLVGAVAARSPRWYPIGDTAMLELRVRDVGTRHTPLIGVPGRIGSGDVQGSHPGPLSVYALAVPYRLLGSSAWALQVATFVLHAAAMVTAVLIGYRRGGLRIASLVGLAMAGLVSGYGFAVLVSPWNPYLPLLWWMVVLLAVWSVSCGDVSMLPVAVGAGALCAQTHVPYLGMTLGLAALVVVVVAVAYCAEPRGSPSRRRIARWAGGSLGLGVLVWLPPVLDEFDNSPGNLVTLWKLFTNPTEPPLGFSEAGETVVRHLDPSWFLHTQRGLGFGVAFLIVWAASVLLAWKLKAYVWLRLHLVIGVALVLAVYSVSRIFGQNWYYLSLWAWGVMAAASVAIIGTASAALESRSTSRSTDIARRVVPGVLALILGVTLISATVDAVDVTPPEQPVWTELSLLTGPTKAALEEGRGAANGPDGRYLVTWEDPLLFGSQGFGLLNELERAGFDVGVSRLDSVSATRHRVVDARNATAIVHLATGGAVVYSRTRPGNVEVATVDSRTEEERAEFDDLRAETIAALDAAGLRDLAGLVDNNLFAAGLDPRMPGPLRPKVARMFELGQELAVFILPPDAFG